MYREIISDSNAWMKYGFDLGILGPTAKGRQTQSAVHRFPYLHAAQPQGWDTQIRDEYGIQLFAENGPGSLRGNFRVRILCMNEVFNVEAAPIFRLNAGNILVNAEASIRFRFGQFDPVFKRPSVSGGINPGITPGEGTSLHAVSRELSRERYLSGRSQAVRWAIMGRSKAVGRQRPLWSTRSRSSTIPRRGSSVVRGTGSSVTVLSYEARSSKSRAPNSRSIGSDGSCSAGSIEYGPGIRRSSICELPADWKDMGCKKVGEIFFAVLQKNFLSNLIIGGI